MRLWLEQLRECSICSVGLLLTDDSNPIRYIQEYLIDEAVARLQEMRHFKGLILLILRNSYILGTHIKAYCLVQQKI
jgi:hypothetical protein